MSELPTGTVTFLFTDIEHSTEILKRLGDDYRDVLSRHRAIVREAFAARNGVEIDTQGDAFFFVFARSRDALAAAVEVQQAHAVETWPAGVDVRVRIGLHTGEPALHEEGYVGLDVVRAARICMVGRGGQILLSGTTRALIGSELPEGVSVFPLGQRQLRGIDEPERVYEVAIDGLELEEVASAPAATPAAPAVHPSGELQHDISRRFEEMGQRLATSIQEGVQRSLGGTRERARERSGKPSSADDIAAKVASLGDEIDARIQDALAKRGIRSKGT